jgi:hypothetical protein
MYYFTKESVCTFQYVHAGVLATSYSHPTTTHITDRFIVPSYTHRDTIKNIKIICVHFCYYMLIMKKKKGVYIALASIYKEVWSSANPGPQEPYIETIKRRNHMSHSMHKRKLMQTLAAKQRLSKPRSAALQQTGRAMPMHCHRVWRLPPSCSRMAEPESQMWYPLLRACRRGR